MVIWFIMGLSGLLVAGMLPVTVPLVRQHAWYTLGSMLLVFPATVILLYTHWGSGPAMVKHTTAVERHHELQQQFAALGTPEEIIVKLKSRVEQTPTDAKGWYLLGRLYFSEKRYDEASIALAHANVLQPNNSQMMFHYALALLGQGTPSSLQHAKALVNAAAQLDPHNAEIKELVAST